MLLDHVLSPTLTDEQFATEVFHVDGEGQAKGVVYCEMQGREATEDDLSDHNLHELLYPGSGYRFECGGLVRVPSPPPLHPRDRESSTKVGGSGVVDTPNTHGISANFNICQTPDIERISNSDVRTYHKRYYCPSNTLVLVHGQVPKELVEEALGKEVPARFALAEREAGAALQCASAMMCGSSC